MPAPLLFSSEISFCEGSKSINLSPLDLSIMTIFGKPRTFFVDSTNCSSCMLSGLSILSITTLAAFAPLREPADIADVDGSYFCCSAMNSLVGDTINGHCMPPCDIVILRILLSVTPNKLYALLRPVLRSPSCFGTRIWAVPLFVSLTTWITPLSSALKLLTACQGNGRPLLSSKRRLSCESHPPLLPVPIARINRSRRCLFPRSAVHTWHSDMGEISI